MVMLKMMRREPNTNAKEQALKALEGGRVHE